MYVDNHIQIYTDNISNITPIFTNEELKLNYLIYLNEELITKLTKIMNNFSLVTMIEQIAKPESKFRLLPPRF